MFYGVIFYGVFRNHNVYIEFLRNKLPLIFIITFLCYINRLRFVGCVRQNENPKFRLSLVKK